MPRAEFEPAIPATKRQQTYALDRLATGIDSEEYDGNKFEDTSPALALRE
jgi:hypothetical protein